MLNIFLSLILSLSVQAQVNSPGNQACEKRYVLSFQDDAPGFYIDKNGKKNGLAYDLLLEIVKRLGCKSTEQITSFLVLRDNFLRNRSDIYALAARDEQLDKVAEFVEMYSFPRTLVVNRKNSGDKDTIATLLKNPKIDIGNVRGGRLFMREVERVDLEKTHRLKEFPGPTGVFTALLDGRVQAVFSSPAFTYYFINRENKMDQFRSLPDTSGEVYLSGFYLSRTRLSDSERKKIREIILAIRGDGTLEKFARKYVNEEDLKYYRPSKP